jgi:hypothetical protein
MRVGNPRVDLSFGWRWARWLSAHSGSCARWQLLLPQPQLPSVTNERQLGDIKVSSDFLVSWEPRVTTRVVAGRAYTGAFPGMLGLPSLRDAL